MCKKLSSRECNLCQQVNSTILQGQVNTYSGPDRFFPPLPAPNEAKESVPYRQSGILETGFPSSVSDHCHYGTSRPALRHRVASAPVLRGCLPSAVPLFSDALPLPMQVYGRPSPTEGRTTITGLTSAPRRSPSCRRSRLRERPWAGPCRRSESRSRRLRGGCG